MLRKYSVGVLLLAATMIVGGCGKKEEPAPKAAAPSAAAPSMTPAPGGEVNIQVPPKQEQQVVVPDAVKGKWRGVRLVVEDKASKGAREYEVKLNADFQVPGSGVVVKVGDFLPNFVMNGPTLTSLDNEPINPALKVVILENGKELFSGWLFSKYPQIHPFEHPKFGITLKEGTPGKG